MRERLPLAPNRPTAWLVLALLGLLLALGGCATGAPDGVQAVRGFDLARYEGEWFEIARLDHRFERGLTRVTAQYRRQPDGSVLKIPHMGWNQVRQAQRHPLWDGVADDSWFYFVHSYYVEPAVPSLTAGTADYGTRFTCVVAADNIFATQFHPEKSAAAGLRIYENFTRWNP